MEDFALSALASVSATALAEEERVEKPENPTRNHRRSRSLSRSPSPGAKRRRRESPQHSDGKAVEHSKYSHHEKRRYRDDSSDSRDKTRTRDGYERHSRKDKERGRDSDRHRRSRDNHDYYSKNDRRSDRDHSSRHRSGLDHKLRDERSDRKDPERRSPRTEIPDENHDKTEAEKTGPNTDIKTNATLPGAFHSGNPAAEAKKKLLWAGKRDEAPVVQKTGHWDKVHFADRERQEKFNKLMGVKTKEQVAANTNTSLDKSRELQENLERQYSAGLRRRDGRTVGLGL